MRTPVVLGAALFSTWPAFAQVVIPATNGSLPAAGPNGCTAGYFPGSDTVLYTVPYTYQQVLSIIGNYTNLTWSGSPPNSVTTNCSSALATNDWVPGCARFYDLGGAHVIETITTYSKPANGPYVEFHTAAPLKSGGLEFYSNFDAQVWQPICNGGAVASNFTINFCATNVTVAQKTLHALHMSDAVTVGQFLGGQNFTSCAALSNSSTSGNGTSSANASSTGSPPAVYTGAASVNMVGGALVVLAGIAAWAVLN